MYYVCEKYTITVQYYIANCESWEPRLTFLDLQMPPRNRTCRMQGTYCIHRTVNDCDGSLLVSQGSHNSTTTQVALNHRNSLSLSVLEARSLVSRCLQDYAPPESYRGRFFLAFSGCWWPQLGLGLWQDSSNFSITSHDILPISLHIIFPLSVSVSEFLLFIRTPVIVDWSSP